METVNIFYAFVQTTYKNSRFTALFCFHKTLCGDLLPDVFRNFPAAFRVQHSSCTRSHFIPFGARGNFRYTRLIIFVPNRRGQWQRLMPDYHSFDLHTHTHTILFLLSFEFWSNEDLFTLMKVFFTDDILWFDNYAEVCSFYFFVLVLRPKWRKYYCFFKKNYALSKQVLRAVQWELQKCSLIQKSYLFICIFDFRVVRTWKILLTHIQTGNRFV